MILILQYSFQLEYEIYDLKIFLRICTRSVILSERISIAIIENICFSVLLQLSEINFLLQNNNNEEDFKKWKKSNHLVCKPCHVKRNHSTKKLIFYEESESQSRLAIFGTNLAEKTFANLKKKYVRSFKKEKNTCFAF